MPCRAGRLTLALNFGNLVPLIQRTADALAIIDDRHRVCAQQDMLLHHLHVRTKCNDEPAKQMLKRHSA